ncbi:MAG TPA: hypothetical protein VF718_06220 [Allosphingosinicella sp.]|jgi:hypothetical protein
MATKADKPKPPVDTGTVPAPTFDPCSKERPDIRLKCCRCVGGEGQTIPINSGAAPWRVAGPGVNNPLAQTITPQTLNPHWSATLAPAQWVQPNGNNGNVSHPLGLYYYDLRIEVPCCTVPMEVLVTGQAAGDDSIRIFLDNMSVPIAQTDNSIPVPGFAISGQGGWGFKSERIVPFAGALTSPGMHLLRIEVENGGGPHSMLVRAALKTFCSPHLEGCCC